MPCCPEPKSPTDAGPVDGGPPPCPPVPCSADKIKQNLAACDGGTGAWAGAKGAIGKDPQVQIGPTSSGFGAETDTSTGTIIIKPTTDCCAATEFLLFELHNVEDTAKHTKIDADALSGKLSREEYAQAHERLEYDGVHRNLTAFDKCKSKWGCGPGAKSYFDPFRSAKDFNDFYKNYELPAHKDVYRNWWDSNCKAAYTRNHP